MNEVLKTVISLSVSAGLITLILLALGPVYKSRLHKTWQYYIWLVVVARLLIPFAPETNLVGGIVSYFQQPAPVITQPQEQGIQEERDPAAYELQEPEGYASPESVTDSPAVTTPQRFSSPVADIVDNLWLAWFGVALVLLVRKITSYHSFTRFIRAGRQEVDNPDVLDCYFTACEALVVKNPLPLYTNKLAVSPMLVGILRPYIVLPDVDLPNGELNLIFRHELVHHKRRDIIYKWLVQVAVCLHWFNPLVYLMSREIGKACELSCDEMVLRKLDTEHKRSYGNALMATLKSGGSYGDTVASVTLSEDGKLLKERLEAILRHAKKPRLVAACSVMFAMLLLCGAAFAGAYTGVRAISGDVITTQTDAVANANWEISQAEPIAETTSLESPSKITQNDSYTFYQNYNYRDGYFYGVRWMKDDDSAAYSQMTQMEVDGQMLTFTFTDATESYATDSAFLEAVRQETGSMIRSYSGRTIWTDSVFAIIDASGPHSETPGELAIRLYDQEVLYYFGAVLPYVDNDTCLSLVYRAYEDKKDTYLMYLMRNLPPDVNLDELAQRAADDGRRDALMWMMGHVSEEKKMQLLETALDLRMPSLAQELLDALPNFNTDVLLERAVGDNQVSMAQVLVQQASVGKIKELAGKALGDNKISIFSVLVDELPSSELSEYAEQAFTQGNVSVFSMVYDQLPLSDIESFARRAYETNQVSMFSILADELSNQTATELAEQAVADGKNSFFSILVDELSQSDVERLARQAFDANQISIFSMLADELPPQVAAELADKAIAEGKTSYLSVLSDSISQGDAYSLAKKAYESDQISLFTVLIDELSDEALKEFAQRSFDDRKYNFQAVLMKYM